MIPRTRLCVEVGRVPVVSSTPVAAENVGRLIRRETSMDWCPIAVRDDKGANNGGAFVASPPRGVLHTTEGPTYASARAAFAEGNTWPHFSVTFEGGVFKAFQHLSVWAAARSLEHRPGSVNTNRLSAIQIEIVGAAISAPNFSKKYLAGLASIMRWIEENVGVSQSCAVTFARPGAEIRLTDRQWLSYQGWCGHQHVPKNEHEDPGCIDIEYLLKAK